MQVSEYQVKMPDDLVSMERYLGSGAIKGVGEVLKNVCKQLNDYPYTTIEYEMLKESTYPYTNIERINQEKERILLHLEAIKADCNALAMDVQKTLKLKDVVEEDTFSFSANLDEEEEEE